FQISLHWYAAFPFHLPLTPHTVKCRNNLISKYAKMSLYSVLIKLIVRCAFQLGVFDLQELESSARKASCNFTNITFKLWSLSD
ncbi:hypothetical protein DBR06_SOUSAS13010016, partial [Sousa chinensis]